MNKKLLGIVAFTSLVCSFSVHFALGYWVPSIKIIGSQADAVAIANTYIVFTTFLVTGFAALVAFFSFYFTQHTTELRMKEFQEKLFKDLEEGEDFSKKIQALAAGSMEKQINALPQSENFTALVGKVIEAAREKLDASSKRSANEAAVLEQVRNLNDK